jgi:toxin ParE1/3/4
MARRPQVIWSSHARQDLREIKDYISKDSKENARNFLAKIRAVASTLGNFPDKFVQVPELGHPYRQQILGNYRLIYSVSEKRLIVLGVFRTDRLLWKAIGNRL